VIEDMEAKSLPIVILDAFGGAGSIFRKVYPHVTSGTVIEREPSKVDLLCWQRPTWAVYQGDTPALLRSGVGGHQSTSLLDVDPYGQPWDALGAFFASLSEGLRPQSPTLYVVVNDGARQYLRRRAAAIWETDWLPEDLLKHYGNALELNYTEVAKTMLERLGASVGYDTTWMDAYQTGHVAQNTHYACRMSVSKS